MLAKPRGFLVSCAAGLVPIALSYGAWPSATIGALFGIQVDTENLTHILRAVMGLYLGMVVLWLLGAFRASTARPALVSLAVFMIGSFAGRAPSLLLDGPPDWQLIVYAGLEPLRGLIAMSIYSKLPCPSP